MTADSATPSSRASTCSTSAGYTLKPPQMYMSLSRSVMVRFPAGVEAADVTGVQPAVGVDGGRVASGSSR